MSFGNNPLPPYAYPSSANQPPPGNTYPTAPYCPPPSGTTYPPPENYNTSIPAEPPPGSYNPYAGPPPGNYNPYGQPAGPPPGNYNPYGQPAGPPPGNYNPYGQPGGPPPVNYNPYGQNQPQVVVMPTQVLYDSSVPAPVPTKVQESPASSDDDAGWNAIEGNEDNRRGAMCCGGLDGPVRVVAILGAIFLFIGVFALIATVVLYSGVKSPYSGTAVLFIIGTVIYLLLGAVLLIGATCGIIDSYNSHYRDQRRCTFLMGQLAFLCATALMGLGIAVAGQSAGQRGYVDAVFKLHFEDFANSTQYPSLKTAEDITRATETGLSAVKVLSLIFLFFSIFACAFSYFSTIYFHKHFMWGVWNALMIPAVIYSVCGFWVSIGLFAIHRRAPSLYDSELLGGIWIYCVVSFISLALMVGFNLMLTFWVQKKDYKNYLIIGWIVGVLIAFTVGFAFQLYVPLNVAVPKNDCAGHCLTDGYYYACGSSLAEGETRKERSSVIELSDGRGRSAGFDDTTTTSVGVYGGGGGGGGIRMVRAVDPSCTTNSECTKVFRSLALYHSITDTRPVEQKGSCNYTEPAEGWFKDVKKGVYDLKVASIWVCIAATIPNLLALAIITVAGICMCMCLTALSGGGRYGRCRHW